MSPSEAESLQTKIAAAASDIRSAMESVDCYSEAHGWLHNALGKLDGLLAPEAEDGDDL